MSAHGENPIDIWIVEDNDNFRRTVHELLEREPGMHCSLASVSGEEAVMALERGHVPDVVLMDLGLPGMSGTETIRRIKALSPVTTVVVLTVREDDDAVFEAICTGASGYLLKPASRARIVEAVRTAVDGGSPMNAFIARRVLDRLSRTVRPRSDHDLTDRERELLELLCEERTQKEIAEVLFLSPHTVDTHLRNIYRKLHVRSRAGAVAKAIREGLI